MAHRPTPRARANVLDFPKSEYEARIEGLHRAMHARGLNAVFIADERTQRYFTGHYSPRWDNRARPIACWIQMDRGATIIVPEVDAAWAQGACAESVVAYGDNGTLGPGRVAGAPFYGFDRPFAEALLEVARAFGLGQSSRVGIPLGPQSRVNVSVGVLDQLRAELGGEWVDIMDAIWDLRVVKSPRELEYMRSAVDVLDATFADFISTFRRGMTEVEAIQRFRSALYLHGAEDLGYTNLHGDVRELFLEPSPTPIADDALWFIDAGAVVGGYWSDYSRVLSNAPPSARQRRAFSTMVESLRAGAEAARPGVTAGDVAKAVISAMPGGRAAPGFHRVGHAIGLEQPEPPSLHPSDQTVLKPGMALCIEPAALVPDIGVLVIEDVFVVTDDGCRTLASNLSRPWEIAVIE